MAQLLKHLNCSFRGPLVEAGQGSAWRAWTEWSLGLCSCWLYVDVWWILTRRTGECRLAVPFWYV